MNLHCDRCHRNAICVCHLPDNPTDGALEILESARVLVLEAVEQIPAPFRTRHYTAATCLTHALLHIAGFTGPVEA